MQVSHPNYNIVFQELEAVNWQNDSIVLLSLLFSLIDESGREDDAKDIKKEQNSWKEVRVLMSPVHWSLSLWLLGNFETRSGCC